MLPECPMRMEYRHQTCSPSAKLTTPLEGLGLETVPLIDANDIGSAARNVAKDSLGDLQSHPQPLHAGRHGAPQVVEAPVGDAVWASSRALQLPAEQLAAVSRQRLPEARRSAIPSRPHFLYSPKLSALYAPLSGPGGHPALRAPRCP
jgi:hypothetical protein